MQEWLKKRGFSNFTCFGQDIETYENKPVNSGGIRIEVCGDVASVWKAGVYNNPALPTSEVIAVVESLM